MRMIVGHFTHLLNLLMSDLENLDLSSDWREPSWVTPELTAYINIVVLQTLFHLPKINWKKRLAEPSGLLSIQEVKHLHHVKRYERDYSMCDPPAVNTSIWLYISLDTPIWNYNGSVG